MTILVNIVWTGLGMILGFTLNDYLRKYIDGLVKEIIHGVPK